MKRECGFFLISILISSLFLIFVPVPSVATEPVRVYVNPPMIVDPSAMFNVSINVENLVELAGAQWKLTWDPALLRVVRIVEVMFHETIPPAEWDNIWQINNYADNVFGFANYAYTYVDQKKAVEGGYCPITGNHTIAILTFQVVGVGNCSLHIATSKLANMAGDPIVNQTTDGFFSNSIAPIPIPPGPMEDSQLLFYITPHRVMNNSLIVNSTFSVTLEMDTIAAHRGIYDMEFQLRWNATILECVSVQESMFHEVTPSNESGNIYEETWSNASPGQVGCYTTFFNYTRATELGYAPVFGNHTVAVVTFKVKNVGATLLHLDYCWASDPLDTTILYSSLDGFFGNRIKGDLNGDGVVDLFDALLFANSFGTQLRVYPGYPNWNEEADLNGDGVIDIFDAIQLCACLGRST
jgi:hypothetical protein